MRNSPPGPRRRRARIGALPGSSIRCRPPPIPRARESGSSVPGDRSRRCSWFAGRRCCSMRTAIAKRSISSAGFRWPLFATEVARETGAQAASPEHPQPPPDDVAKPPAEPADALACRVRLDQGRALRKEREYSRARVALAQVVLRCAESDVRSRALYVLAQLETITGKDTAGPLWEALARKYPQSNLADDAVFNQALAARRAGDLEKERALLRDLVDHFPGSDLRSDALFRLFWSHWSEGRPRDGLMWLDQLAASQDSDGYEEERARYWRARSLLEPQYGETELARNASAQAA